jgi:hypothetical protein
MHHHGDKPDEENMEWHKESMRNWRSWGSWFSWGSPVGLSIFLLSVGGLIVLLHIAGLWK